MRGVVAACALAVAAALVGCSLLVPLDGFSNGVDGTADGSDARSSFGSEGGVSEAGADAGDAGVDPCIGAALCDDFERDVVLGNGWTSFDVSEATMSLDRSTFASATRSLKLHVPGGASPAGSLFFKASNRTASALHLSFAMRTDVAPNREIQLIELDLAHGSDAEVVLLSLLPGRISLAEQKSSSTAATYDEHEIGNALVLGKWQRWSIDLDASGPKARATVTVDGIVRLDQALTNTFSSGVPVLSIGANFVRDGADRDVWFDDVAFRFGP